ncbi:MAG: hypothetical protein JW885_02520 [Deltaproteobacteria bacterium]|mgnify:CR=1 FL=1|nr:hypothetical protein [Candidatus Zymogenaceae bacterium]
MDFLRSKYTFTMTRENMKRIKEFMKKHKVPHRLDADVKRNQNWGHYVLTIFGDSIVGRTMNGEYYHKNILVPIRRMIDQFST